MNKANDGFFSVILGVIIATLIVLVVLQVPKALDNTQQRYDKPEYVKQAEIDNKLREIEQGQ